MGIIKWTNYGGSMTVQKRTHILWPLLPIWWFWRWISWIVKISGRLIAIVVGCIFIIIGIILSVTIIGLIVGIPMILIGLLLIFRGLF